MQENLQELQQNDLLQKFYLAGGTALALHFGHRRSRDLDFFSSGEFDEDLLLSELQKNQDFKVIARDRQTLHVHLRGIKLSFLGYPYPVLFPLSTFLGVSVADARDIACMKVSAIAARGAKRDFVDLYTAARPYGLAEIIRLFATKFAEAKYSRMHVLKSLTYFDDAEADPMPDMLESLSWADIKEFFEKEAPRLL